MRSISIFLDLALRIAKRRNELSFFPWCCKGSGRANNAKILWHLFALLPFMVGPQFDDTLHHSKHWILFKGAMCSIKSPHDDQVLSNDAQFWPKNDDQLWFTKFHPQTQHWEKGTRILKCHTSPHLLIIFYISLKLPIFLSASAVCKFVPYLFHLHVSKWSNFSARHEI